MRFVDTNVFVRHLANDLPERSLACKRFFRRLERGDEVAMTSEAVVAEVAHVITSRVTYGMSHEMAAAALRTILASPGLRIESKRRVLRALDLFGQHQFLDFVDALIAAQVEESDVVAVLSDDRDFDRVAGVTREEP